MIYYSLLIDWRNKKVIKTIYTYGDVESIPLQLTYYPAVIEKDLPTICYFHGGGLIYGKRDDLPLEYIQQFIERGYPFLTIDYPFIPEIKIDTILECLENAIQWFLNESQKKLNLTNHQFVYFGRSAGAYLALLLAAKITYRPKALISFYGYYSLALPELNQPSQYYQQFPAVPYMQLHDLLKSHPTVESTIEERFPIYLGYRQMGNWIKEICGTLDPSKYSLEQKELESLPPTFIAVSKEDQDVPYQISLEMSKTIICSDIYIVDDLPHDLDRQPELETSQRLYKELLSWLGQQFC